MNKISWQTCLLVFSIIFIGTGNVAQAGIGSGYSISKVSSGIFRGSRSTVNRKSYRIDSTPNIGSGRLQRHSKKVSSVIKGRMRVRFSAKIPRGLGIRNSEVQWQIKSKSGKGAAVTSGKQTTVRLSPGAYTVRLRIGSYEKTESITIRKSRNNTQLVPIAAKLGLLNISSRIGNVDNAKKVRWTVFNMKGKIVATAVGNNIRHLVPAGRYKVLAQYDNAKQDKTIVVRQGKIGRGTIKLPSGSIRFSAFSKNIREPIFSKTHWVIYDSKNKEISRGKKHNLRLTLFPGKYTVELKAKGKSTRKSFTVSTGKNPDVRLIVN